MINFYPFLIIVDWSASTFVDYDQFLSTIRIISTCYVLIYLICFTFDLFLKSRIIQCVDIPLLWCSCPFFHGYGPVYFNLYSKQLTSENRSDWWVGGGMTHQRKTFLKLYLNPPGKERKMDDSFNALFYMYYKRSDILISIKLNFHNKDNLE